MSPWAKYLKEREGVNVLEDEFGFVVYSIVGKECYIRDIWVDENVRNRHLAAQLADEVCVIAREAGCSYITGTVCPMARGSTTSLKVLLGYNMTLVSATNNLIIFKKDL